MLLVLAPLSTALAQEVAGKWKLSDGSAIVEVYQDGDIYNGKIVWLKNPTAPTGGPAVDKNNPDEKLRNVDVDKIVIVKGLKYDAEDKCWGGAKIYDPTKGMKVNAEAKFETADKLKLRGTILGMGVTLYWTRIKQEK